MTRQAPRQADVSLEEPVGTPARTRERTAPANPLRQIWHNLITRRELVVLILMLITALFLGLATDTFFTANNLSNISRAFSWIAVAAFGQCLVMITGGIDLSVGATMALAGLIAARCMQAGIAVPWAIAAGLLTGAIVGLINGTMVARLRLPAYIITLITMSIARGIAFALTGGWPVRDLPQVFRTLGQYDLPVANIGVPMPVLIMLGMAVLVSLLLRQTVVGRHIYTVSSGERALFFSGVNVVQVKILVYTLCGLLAAVAGLMMTARLAVAAPTAAVGYEVDIVAAAVVGGTSLFGGEGSIVGVLLGAAILQMLRSGLVLLGFPAYWGTVTMGSMILFAILLDYWRRQR